MSVVTKKGDMLRVLVVDDHPVIGEALKMKLMNRPSPAEVTVTYSAKSAIAKFQTNKYDLVIVDLDLPDQSGTDLIRDFRARCPEVKVLVFTSKEYKFYACWLKTMNICGFLPKTEDLDKVATVIELAARDYAVLPNTDPIAYDHPFKPLSSRELAVALLIAKGRRNEDIAQNLSISPKTVAVHKMNLMRKLGATSTIDVAHLVALYKLL